jgi:hypothetical protein
MKTLVVSALMLMLLTSVGLSQASQSNLSGRNSNTDAAATDAARSRAASEQKKQEELDAAYHDALQKNKAPTAPHDPWGIARPSNGAAAGK